MSEDRIEWAVVVERENPLGQIIPGLTSWREQVAGPYPSREEAEAYCAAHGVSRERRCRLLRERGYEDAVAQVPVPFVVSRRVGDWQR